MIPRLVPTRGLTLVEIMASLFVLTIGLGGILAIVFSSVRTGATAADRNNVAIIIPEAIDEITRSMYVSHAFAAANPAFNQFAGEYIVTSDPLPDRTSNPNKNKPFFRVSSANTTSYALTMNDLAYPYGTKTNLMYWPFSKTYGRAMGQFPDGKNPTTNTAVKPNQDEQYKSNGLIYRGLFKLEKHPQWSANINSEFYGIYLLTFTLFRDLEPYKFTTDKTKRLEQVSDPVVVYLKRQGPVILRARPSSGFTLLEVLMAASIATVVFYVGYYAIVTTIGASNQATQHIRDAENARLFFKMLEKDLRSALPGPGKICKYRETTSDAYSAHDPESNPAPLVISQNTYDYELKKSGISQTYYSDILQFYCHTDGAVSFPESNQKPIPSDEFVFVRYYINQFDHTLCRVTEDYHPDPSISQFLPDSTFLNAQGSPTSSLSAVTGASNTNPAIFDNVRQLIVKYRRWDENNRVYIEESSLNLPPNNIYIPVLPTSQPDTLVVSIVFTNSFQDKAIVANASSADKSSDKIQTMKNNSYRMFSKVIPIPTVFKN